MLNLFQSSVITVLLPKVAACPMHEIYFLTRRAARISLVLTLLIAAVLAVISPLLLQVLYGAEFLQAIAVLRILLLEVVLSSTTWILAQAFMATGQPGVVTLLQGIGLGLNLPLMLILIPEYGLVGAGLSLLISTSIRLYFILACFPLILNVPPPNLLISVRDFNFIKRKVLGKN
jgi:O-antigen/teichoic acid export membrane protein